MGLDFHFGHVTVETLLRSVFRSAGIRLPRITTMTLQAACHIVLGLRLRRPMGIVAGQAVQSLFLLIDSHFVLEDETPTLR